MTIVDHLCFFLVSEDFNFCNVLQVMNSVVRGWSCMSCEYLNKIGLLVCHSHIELRLRLRLSRGWVNVELRAKLGFHRIRVMVENISRSSHIAEQNLFSLFPSFLTFDFISFKGGFWPFGLQNAILRVRIRFKNCVGVYSNSAKTFIFFVSFNSDIWFRLNLGLVLAFWGPNQLFFGLE